MKKESPHQTRSEQIAGSVKTAGTAARVSRLIKDIAGLVLVSVLMLLLMSWGIPAWFCFLVIGMMAAFVVLEIIGLKRNARVNLDELYEPEPVEVRLEPGEEAVFWIPGVMQAWKTRSTAVLGTGRVLTPENTLLLSSKGIWALTVPLPGADKVVSDTDIGKWQFLNAWRDIENKLNEMLSGSSLEKTLRECRAKRICLYPQIKNYKFTDLTQGITLKLHDRKSHTKSYTYSIRDKDIFLKARGVLSSLMS
jgi:hypothetical protein